jgi:hypothetical protein
MVDLVKVNMQSTAFKWENQTMQGGKTMFIASTPLIPMKETLRRTTVTLSLNEISTD